MWRGEPLLDANGRFIPSFNDYFRSSFLYS